MNDSTLKDLANEQMPLNTAIRGFISQTNYINLGVISEVHDENYVDVKLYYVDSTGKEMIIPAVRLLHVGTTKCKLNITPAVGDNILLLCPKDFIKKLEYNKKPDKSGVCYLPYGNMNMCGVLVKDEADDNVKTTIKIDEEGTISVETEGDVNLQCKGDANVVAEGNVSVEAKQNATLKSQNTKLTGGIVEIGGAVTPSGQGALCGMPYCAYSGAPQTGKQTQGA